jgi:hypothetical protein
MVVSGGHYYACSTRLNGGPSASSNDVRIALKVVEPLLHDDLRRSLRNPAAMAETRRRLRQRLQASNVAPKVTDAQVRRAEHEVANLTEAIASGVLRASPALAARLQQAEGDLARLQAARVRPTSTTTVERLVAGLDARIERVVDDLEWSLLAVDIERGRQEVRDLLGQIKVEADHGEIRFYNEQGRVEAALLKCIGADARNCGSGGLLPIQAIPLDRSKKAVVSVT